ncbi:MAG TPA: YetF domain-containing protein [Pseudolabrys sp.]|nr:YetF domain-containing protein [Pseudolabrys sp.]
MDALHQFAETVLGLSKQSHQLLIWQICIRAVVVYLVMIAFVRFGKKRFLGRATAFDAILVIVIGSTAARAITGNSPFVGTLACVFVLIALHWLISLFARNSPALGWLVKGQPDMLVRDGNVNVPALKKAHMSADDLHEDLRQQGVDKLAEVKEARLERSGQLSVIKK